MDILIIFIPNFIKNYKDVYFYGEVYSCTFYILGIVTKETLLKKRNFYNIIGCQNISDHIQHKTKSWLNIDISENNMKIKEIILNGQNYLLTNSIKQIVIIQYNYVDFDKSEMLYLCQYKSENYVDRDHFQILWHQIKKKQKKENNSMTIKFLNSIFIVILYFISFLSQILNLGMPLFRYSALVLQFDVSLKSLKWALDAYFKKSQFSIKIANYLVSTIFDVLLGIFILNYFVTFCENVSPENKVLDNAEIIVENLSHLLEWVMGSPAGLKLNHPFSKTLGLFFLYHVQLWWIFLEKCTTLLHFLFKIFYWFGHLGLSFQISILSDILSLVGFHIYCIYVYAAKLYHIQIYTLISLSRLFFGKKFNPLRKKIDSCEYSPDQLFFGILAFTILLFLLPTTFVYYVVFTTMRLCMVSLGGILTRIKFFLQAFPLLITYLWIIRSPKLTSSFKIEIDKSLILDKSPWSNLVLSVQPILGSLGLLIKENVAETITKPPDIPWGSLINKFIFGELVYPF